MYQSNAIFLNFSLATALSLLGTSVTAADLAIRKNVVELTPEEKTNFVEAIYTLKNTIPEGSNISIYDQFVAVHVGAMSLIHQHQMNEEGPEFSATFDAAHGNSSFLPWHREYILRFEAALQSVNPDVTLPYWDWNQKEALDVIFQKDFLGTNGKGIPVELPAPEGDLRDLGGSPANLGTLPNSEEGGSGAFGNLPEGGFEGGPLPDDSNFSQASGWILNEELNINPETKESLGTSLTRFLQVPPATEYPLPQQQTDRMLALDDYLLFRPALEGYITVDQEGNIIRGGYTHNYIHAFVGGAVVDDSDLDNIRFQGLGTMANVPSSPYDPTFWLLHTNVDRNWAQWQDNGHAGSEYYPTQGQPYGHNLNDPMWPWDGNTMIPIMAELQNLAFFLPAFDSDDVVRPVDVLDYRSLGYTYDTSVQASNPASVPEPTSIIGLLNLGFLGASLRLLRRQK